MQLRGTSECAMSDSPNRLSIIKRLLIATVALVAFTMASVIGARIAVESFSGHREFESTGLSAFALWILARCCKKA